MPMYLFEDVASGELVRLSYSMADAPSIGTLVSSGPKNYLRLPETDIQIDVGAIRYKYPYVSQSLPRNLEGCKTMKSGKPIIESKSHEANVASRHGYERDY
tara:strand:- start:492 stop:794 length:303 start_codon:yes stop_codon:yes gene_type:complete